MLAVEPSSEELEGLGLTREDVAEQYTCEVLPDVWPAALLFVDLLTQWRVGMGGPTGLDYTAIPAVFDLRGIPREDRSRLFDDIRVMESVALTTYAARRRSQ